MQWRRCERVQTVAALLLRGLGPADAAMVLTDIGRRSLLFGDLLISLGGDWLVIEGCADPEQATEVLLPEVGAAVPLYRVGKGIYCAIGFELAAPPQISAQLLAHFRHRLSLNGPCVLVPSKTTARALDIFNIAQAQKLGTIDLAEIC